MRDIDLSQIEPRIRPIVQQLRVRGYDTIQSCGHDMWVLVDAVGVSMETLAADLQALGHGQFKLMREHLYERNRHIDLGIRIEFFGDFPHDDGLEQYVLLEIDPSNLPIHILLRSRVYDVHPDSHEAYLYDEHTCPTNWTGDIVEIFAQGQPDPHGVARYVARAPVRTDADEDGYDWAEVFPALAKASNNSASPSPPTGRASAATPPDS